MQEELLEEHDEATVRRWCGRWGCLPRCCACLFARRHLVWMLAKNDTQCNATHTHHRPPSRLLSPRRRPPQMKGRRSWRENWLVFKHYWPRLLVTCGAWVVNDLAFYGVGSLTSDEPSACCHSGSPAASPRRALHPAVAWRCLQTERPPKPMPYAFHPCFPPARRTSFFRARSLPSSPPAPPTTCACSGPCSTVAWRSADVSGAPPGGWCQRWSPPRRQPPSHRAAAPACCAPLATLPRSPH